MAHTHDHIGPHQPGGAGDPHITTLNGATYTL